MQFFENLGRLRLWGGLDYYPFGMEMVGRAYNPALYRFGFNGKENDNEVKGVGDQQNYGMRIYDPRLGRFLSIDPLAPKYPWYSPYHFSGNNPVTFVDQDGAEEKKPEIKQNVLIIIPSANNIKSGAYGKKDAGVHGNWFVIIANNVKDANKQFKQYTNSGKVNNLVIASHGTKEGGVIATNNNINGNKQMSGIDRTELEKAPDQRDPGVNEEIESLKGLIGGVKEGGNVVVTSCNAATGDQGKKLGKDLSKSLTKGSNLYLSDDYLDVAKNVDQILDGNGQIGMHELKNGFVKFSSTSPNGTAIKNDPSKQEILNLIILTVFLLYRRKGSQTPKQTLN